MTAPSKPTLAELIDDALMWGGDESPSLNDLLLCDAAEALERERDGQRAYARSCAMPR